MKKTVTALIILLPLLFVLVIFSAGNAASLTTPVSANGIAITNKPDHDTLAIDLATYSGDFQLQAQVSPVNAANKGFTYRVRDVEGSQRADVRVSDTGVITASSTGVARVEVVSNDGGYTDGITVSVGSSLPTDFHVSLAQVGGDGHNVLSAAPDGYQADVVSGNYAYTVSVLPTPLAPASVEVVQGTGVLDASRGYLLLPFSGDTVLRITLHGTLNGDIVKYVRLHVTRRNTASGFTVNGESDLTLLVDKQAATASFYVQADAVPELEPSPYVSDCDVVALATGCYRVTLQLAARPDALREIPLTVRAGGATQLLTLSLKDFAFGLRADLPGGEEGHEAAMLVGSSLSVFAVPAVPAPDVTYHWSVRALVGMGAQDVTLQPSADGGQCVVRATATGSCTLVATAWRGGSSMGVTATLDLSVIRNLSSVVFDAAAHPAQPGLGDRTVVAGWQYRGDVREANRYALQLHAFSTAGTVGEDVLSDLTLTSSDPQVATLQIEDGVPLLIPRASGEVTVNVAWKGNASFGTHVGASLRLYVAANATEARTYDQLRRLSEGGRDVVLCSDIHLGSDDAGSPLPEATLRATLNANVFRSTYNTEYYGLNQDKGVGSPNLHYAIELKGNVYGNGYTLNAEYFTNAKDGTGKPIFFTGPIYFVNAGFASVAGQDNVAFLMRTPGKILYNVNLLGCSDEALTGDGGQYNLSNLDNVGTVLEVNASTTLRNCRVRNGRNVVRVYGGNRDGNAYFLDSLAANPGCDGERAVVSIEGCVLSQGREFIVKVGANRALRATAQNGGAEPALTDQTGNPYPSGTNAYFADPYFYSRYVMTDVTMDSCVLETSGFFCVGLESNFSGPMLYRDAPDDGGVKLDVNWKGIGGTSFASVLRLKGDVRMYDWKDLGNVDSSTLIQIGVGASTTQSKLKLDIGAMLESVTAQHPDLYGNLLLRQDGASYVHGGIAFYGGGKNYAQLDDSALAAARRDYTRYDVNIRILADGRPQDLGDPLYLQGTMLPLAAGEQDFRFYLYGTDSGNTLAKQNSDAGSGNKYTGLTRGAPFLS